MLNNIKGEDMDLSTFGIRFEAIGSHFREDHNPLRYKTELSDLAHDIGRHADEEDNDLLYLYRAVKRELSFVVGSKTVRG